MPTVSDVLDTMDYGPAPESNSHVKEWLAVHAKGFGHFIGGAFVAPSAKRLDVFNPATGEKIASVSNGIAKDVDRAVEAAAKAFKIWSRLSGFERAKHLYALARHIQARTVPVGFGNHGQWQNHS